MITSRTRHSGTRRVRTWFNFRQLSRCDTDRKGREGTEASSYSRRTSFPGLLDHPIACIWHEVNLRSRGLFPSLRGSRLPWLVRFNMGQLLRTWERSSYRLGMKFQGSLGGVPIHASHCTDIRFTGTCCKDTGQVLEDFRVWATAWDLRFVRLVTYYEGLNVCLPKGSCVRSRSFRARSEPEETSKFSYSELPIAWTPTQRVTNIAVYGTRELREVAGTPLTVSALSSDPGSQGGGTLPVQAGSRSTGNALFSEGQRTAQRGNRREPRKAQ